MKKYLCLFLLVMGTLLLSSYTKCEAAISTVSASPQNELDNSQITSDDSSKENFDTNSEAASDSNEEDKALETSKILWEIFGYIGTALVIFSMTRTSVVKLRFFNICGSVISLIYSIKMNAWPVVFLNGSLVAINVFQLIRSSRAKVVFDYVKTSLSNDVLQYFAKHNMEDIKKYFPSWSPDASDETEAHIVYMENEIVGVLTGKRINGTLIVGIDYSTPKFRDLSVASFLFAKIKEDGVNILQAQTDVELHEKYLKKMGFEEKDGALIKSL